MAHLIDKDALVAEIERRINSTGDTNQWLCGKLEAYREIHDFLDTLEGEEVDLEKELNKYFITNNLIAADIQFEPVTQMKKCAKHFFELGMRFSAIGSDYIEGVRGYYETTTK